MKTPTQQELFEALQAAGSAHHNYQTEYLSGKNDDQWPGWHAAYTLGKLGEFTSPSILAKWLEIAPIQDDWAQSAANHVARRLK